MSICEMDDAIKLHWPQGGGDKPDPNRPLGVDSRPLDSGPWRVSDWDLDPPRGGPIPDSGTLFSRENEVRDRFLRRNAVLTSQTPPKRGSGMVRMALFRVLEAFLMPF